MLIIRLFSVKPSLPLLHGHLASLSSTKLFCCRQLTRCDGDGNDYGDGGDDDDDGDDNGHGDGDGGDDDADDGYN